VERKPDETFGSLGNCHTESTWSNFIMSDVFITKFERGKLGEKCLFFFNGENHS
jgi:hypothetical protein